MPLTAVDNFACNAEILIVVSNRKSERALFTAFDNVRGSPSENSVEKDY